MTRVSRPSNAYGFSVMTQVTTGRYRGSTSPNGTGSWINHGSTNRRAAGYRKNPVNGTRAGGFRLPTSWMMHAEQLIVDQCAYKCKKGSAYYDFELSGPSPDHGAGFNGYKYSVGKSGVVIDAPLQSADAHLRAKAKLAETKINLGVAAAESRKTFRMLASLARSMFIAVKAARAGRWQEVAHQMGFDNGWRDAKSLSDRWLWFNYGLRPLMNDIYGLQEQIKAGFREKDQIFSVVSEVSESFHPETFITIKPRSSGGKAYRTVRVQYYVRVNNAWLHSMGALGVMNPALIAWELVPYSFVLDWLLPIGQFLEGTHAMVGLDYLCGFETRRVVVDVHWTHTYGPELMSGKPYTAQFKSYTMTRLVITKPPELIMTIRNPFSSTHVTSAAALLRNSRR